MYTSIKYQTSRAHTSACISGFWNFRSLTLALVSPQPYLIKSTLLDNDVDLVARCFEKHQSAKLGNASGLGLNRVLRIIEDLNGFVRFRTSTAEAFFASGDKFDPGHGRA